MGSTREPCYLSLSRPRYHLSVVGEDGSVSENIKLPFDDNSPSLRGGRCFELLYFHDINGKTILFNLTTKELKVLPPPVYDPEPALSFFDTCGLGYDAKSGDYKLIRSYTQHDLDEHGESDCNNSEQHTELYSLKCGFWKEITTPDVDFLNDNGVFVGETGSCYWTADLGYSFGIPEEREFMDSYVVSFDFATESFSHFALPVTTSKVENFYYRLVECGGLLGAIGQTGVYISSESYIELYVRKGQLWNRLYNVSLANVDRVLGIKDGQLLVYDWVIGIWKKLIIYNYHTIVDAGLCLYVESKDLLQLRDSKPKTQKNCSTRGKRKRKRKRKRTGTVLKNKTTFQIIQPLEEVELLRQEN